MRETIGLDLGDQESTFVILGKEGTVTVTGKVATSCPGLRKRFGRMERALIALEVGTHSGWVSRQLKQLGHEVVVANPRQLSLITRSLKKNDRNDAETLARARLVEARTALINHVRGTVKAHGERLPSCSAAAFARKAEEGLPQGLRAALLPLLEAIGWHTGQIQRYDREVERLGKEEYPERRTTRRWRRWGWSWSWSMRARDHSGPLAPSSECPSAPPMRKGPHRHWVTTREKSWWRLA